MKLWVLPHVFKALVGYWSKLTSKSDTLSSKPSLSTDNVSIPLPKQSTQKKGKILKINLSEIPSQSESSNSQLAPKSKRIHKKSKQAIQNKDKKKIQWLENQVKTDCRFMDGSGEEISSIGERDGTDSELTVQDLMGELDPSFQQGRVNVEQFSINVADHPSNFVKHTANNTRLFKKKLNSQLVNDSKNNSPLRKALMIPVSRSQKKNAEKSRKETENSEINCMQKREV